MQSNETNFASPGHLLSLKEKYRLLRVVYPWLRDDEEAQHLYEETQSRLGGTSPRPLSSISALSASSSRTLASISNHSVSDEFTWRTLETPPSTAGIQTHDDNAFYQSSQEPARYLGQQWNTLLFIDKGRRMRTPSSRGSSSRGRTPVPPLVECPLCPVVGIVVTFTRQSEFTRHLKEKHPTNEVYICRQQDCNLAFDRKWAFDRHCKAVHRHTMHSLQVAPTRLQPQKVFACGFTICKVIFEADNNEDVEEKLKAYVAHIGDHLKEDPKLKKAPKPEWNYAVYLKNLMHQKELIDLWKCRKKANPGIKWQPQPHNSYILRKIIETRCYHNAAMLVWCVDAVGYPPYNKPNSPPFPLPHNLSSPLEIDGSGNSGQNALDSLPNDHARRLINAPIPPMVPRTVHDHHYPIQPTVKSDSYIPDTQSTAKVLVQSYDSTMAYTNSASYMNHSPQGRFVPGAYQVPPTFLDAPVSPYVPRHWNSAGYPIDLQILTPDNYLTTGTSMDLDTDQNAGDQGQDYS